ncbi:MAG TPA: GNAT family N-acetyltransferase [Ktedonobacteraceae bacterium]|jgi:GNAT superfamily N-acetyltransferase|nr:GNAT family N-acetyltransferase [Ktedonobacteraceae bacterium]
MSDVTPHIDVRAVHSADAPAIYGLDDTFETDRIYTLRVQNRLLDVDAPASHDAVSFAFELVETSVDPPLYKNHRPPEQTLADVEAKLQRVEGGYVALADGCIAGCVLLYVDEERSVVRIEDLLIGHYYRRYGIGSLLLNCAADWARKRDCWAITLETQNINFPAIQFYLRNGLEIWSIQRHFYPPGASAHETAIIMGKRLTSTAL